MARMIIGATLAAVLGITCGLGLVTVALLFGGDSIQAWLISEGATL